MLGSKPAMNCRIMKDSALTFAWRILLTSSVLLFVPRPATAEQVVRGFTGSNEGSGTITLLSAGSADDDEESGRGRGDGRRKDEIAARACFSASVYGTMSCPGPHGSVSLRYMETTTEGV